VDRGRQAIIGWTESAGGSAGGELEKLGRLHAAGLAVAPIMVMQASSQEDFYRYGNLVRQLSELFRGVDPADPDEDDLDEIAPAAMALVTGSYLLDEVIDEFYETVRLLPPERRVRRPGSAGLTARGDRGSLLAVKRIWADDWSFEALRTRLASTRSFVLEAQSVLLHAADEPSSDPALLGRVSEVLGERCRVWVTKGGSISRLSG